MNCKLQKVNVLALYIVGQNLANRSVLTNFKVYIKNQKIIYTGRTTIHH